MAGLLVVALLGLVVPAGANEPGAASGAGPDVPVVGAATTTTGTELVDELVQLRTATSRTYVDNEGQRVARISPTPLNYRDGNGGWRPIDNTLEATESGFVNRANRYDVELPRDLGRRPCA